ncbi:hypothetical protein L596_000749 [Steinernema carpocapsae]|uniref:Uncharacterized protein n=1 Tax=Steinernema carpocapsae TaxID=34508 RepID=A0A4U8UJD3_STECR|nr:hypothetical protein L596_000749 [Steinernema carpocapsae]
MYGAVAMDPFSNVLVGVVYHQDKGLPWMQMNTKKLAKLAKTTTSTESFYGSQSGYTRQAFDDLQADQFVVDFDEDTRITFLMVPMEVVQTLKEISRQMTYARIFGPEQHQTREEEQRFLEDRALRTSGAYLQERLENDFKNAMWKSHTKAHVEKLSKEVLAIAPTSYLRITCRKKYVQRLAEKVSEHIWTKISMDRLMVIVNSIQRADVDRLVHGVFHQMLTETVSDEAIIQTTHATLNESIEYDIIYGLYSCSFERESLALNFYREIFLDIFKEQALETLLSMQASWLFDEIQRQLAMLRVGLPMPMAYNSKAYVNRYWLSSMAHQIAQSLLIAEQMTDRQLTLAYKQTMEKEMRKKQGEELLKEGVEKIVRSHAKKAWKEERTKELAKLHVQFHNQCYFEYFCLLNNVISELGGKAIASAMDHHTLYVKTVKKMMEEEVDVERRKWQMHYGNIVADVAIDLLDTSFEFFVGIIAQRVSISPDPTVKPNLDDLAHIFACDLQITDSQRPVSLQTLACRKKLIKVCFDNRCKAVERHNARSIFQKRAADRVDRCWEKLHWHFIRQKLMKADPKNNSFDIFVMNTMSQVATRIMRDQKFEILRHRNVPPFIKHVSMCIYGELIVTCGADESFQNLKKQYPGEQLKHLFRRNWDRAVQEEPDACQDFINWVKGLIKKRLLTLRLVAKRMKRLLDGSRFTDGSNIETVMRFRLRRLQELYLNMKFSEQDMKLPFVRTLVARSMAVNGSLRKRSFDEMSSGKDERFKLSDWKTDSSSCSSSETEISNSESEESSSESESVQSDQESP